MANGGKKSMKVYGPLDCKASIFWKEEQNQCTECKCSRFKVESCTGVKDENTKFYDGFKSVSISGWYIFSTSL